MAEHPQVRQEFVELERELTTNTMLTTRTTEITIPVVVHIVYNSSTENISEEQIRSQIDILNQDFNLENKEIANIPSQFAGAAAICNIRFQLATTDPKGQATNGIIRHASPKAVWGVTDDIKLPEKGGFEPWQPSAYLNIYVCNLGTKAVGFSSFPGMSERIDGVVINYTAFGNMGTAEAPFDLGRTCVHEVGHWLGLFHIWGDTDCGNDYVGDTPTHKQPNSGCPHERYSTCKGIRTMDMTMNFMDYVDDACMYMFTKGQNIRMMSLIQKKRGGLINSKGILPASNRDCTIQNIRASKSDTESAHINWNHLNGVAEYSIEYRAANEIAWHSATSKMPYITLKKLQTGTIYEVRVKSDCENSPYSPTVKFGTQRIAFRTTNTPEEAVAVFPNPVSSMAIIAVATNDEADYSVQLSDIRGQIKFEKQYSKETPSVQLDLSELSEGVYFVTVQRNGKRVVNKVMKVRE